MKIIEKIGIVAILDALGTKGRWKEHSHTEIIPTWENLITLYEKRLQTQTGSDYLPKISSFSDTIIFTATGKDDETVLRESIMDLLILMEKAIDDKIFFRGGIGFGKFWEGDKIIIGETIDEVSQYHALPQWMGISLCPSAYNLFKKIKEEKGSFLCSDLFIEYKIPLKIGLENGIALDWNGQFSKSDKREVLKIEMEKRTDFNAILKLRNSLDFANYVATIR